MMRILFAAALVLTGASAHAQVKETRRLQACREVVDELMGVPEGIPRDLLEKAECVAVVPSVKKLALAFGGRYGKGAVACRTDGGHGPWGPPLMITVGGGSFGLQIGGQAADYVFLIMNPRGIDYLLKSRFTLGVDVAAAAGPQGRTAEAATDAQMRAEILAWSRTRGIFVGISLEGAVVSQDKDANLDLYGARVTPKDLLLKPGPLVPPEATDFVDALNRLSPRNSSGW